MKLSVNDLREIANKEGYPMIRFSVTLAEDDGTPLWTNEGWRLTTERVILPPSTMTGHFRSFTKFNIISEKFHDMLLRALVKFPGVEEVLKAPPKVEDIKLVEPEKLKGQENVI
jgi:hypothetical protein